MSQPKSKVNFDISGYIDESLLPAVQEGLKKFASEYAKQASSDIGSEGGFQIGTTKTGNPIWKASSKGSFPGNRTGTLKSSIKYFNLTDDSVTVGIPDNAAPGPNGSSPSVYGPILERTGRPWLSKTWQRNKERFFDIFVKTTAKALA